MSTPGINQFTTDEYVLAYHGPLLYEARILVVDNRSPGNSSTGILGPQYLIHYKGWKQTWDEWVPEQRLLKLNDAAFTLRRKLLEAQTKKNIRPATATPAPATPATPAAPTPKPKDKVGIPAPAAGGKKAETTTLIGKKRVRDVTDASQENLQRPEVKIVIPDVLKLQLVDDWENVTKNNQLVTLPRTPNVRELLEEYRVYVQTTRKGRSLRATNLLSEIISGITIYFDKALGNNLLYRFERAQYVEQRRSVTDKAMSEIYGAEHLLRLFVNFGPFIAYTNIDTDSLNILREYINDIMHWMIKEQKRLFVKEYETTSSSYQSLARA